MEHFKSITINQINFSGSLIYYIIITTRPTGGYDFARFASSTGSRPIIKNLLRTKKIRETPHKDYVMPIYTGPGRNVYITSRYKYLLNCNKCIHIRLNLYSSGLSKSQSWSLCGVPLNRSSYVSLIVALNFLQNQI